MKNTPFLQLIIFEQILREKEEIKLDDHQSARDYSRCSRRDRTGGHNSDGRQTWGGVAHPAEAGVTSAESTFYEALAALHLMKS